MLDGPEKDSACRPTQLPSIPPSTTAWGKTLGKYMMAPSSLFKVPPGDGSIKMLDGPEKDSACRPTQLPSIPPSTTAWEKTLGKYMMAASSLFKVPPGNGSIKMLDGPEKDSACRPKQLPSIPPSITAWGKLWENI
ncbi:hypothetical protein CEXT_709431 [Caerostris extrusa]|uniref:Uncharacterized protein n=1 Tax=Caerostris extrusa TaxID=172846 RepID=A0AAV4MN71_CAEEX|nr:hypothetical protein CEXT_709431 [Caerostris extrusa]